MNTYFTEENVYCLNTNFLKNRFKSENIYLDKFFLVTYRVDYLQFLHNFTFRQTEDKQKFYKFSIESE